MDDQKSINQSQEHRAIPSSESAIIPELDADPSTPRPWRIKNSSSPIAHERVRILGADNDSVATAGAYRNTGEAEANAELIVRAVNAHQDLVDAAEAHLAWDLAETHNIGTFEARMELCNYAQWLTRKALGHAESYSGVPHLLLDTQTINVQLARRSEDACQVLVGDTLKRAASLIAKPMLLSSLKTEKDLEMSVPLHDPPPLIDIFIDCSQCHGKGSVKDEWPSRVNRPYEEQVVTCPKCGGAGEVEIQICHRCRLREYQCKCWERDEMALQDIQELAIGR